MSEDKKKPFTPTGKQSNTNPTNTGKTPVVGDKGNLLTDRKNEVKEAPDTTKTTTNTGKENKGQHRAK